MKTLRTLTLGAVLAGLTLTASAQSWLTNGLVAYYPFNGNANDESGNGNDGTVKGATFAEDRFETPSRSYSFDGQSSKICIVEPLFNLGQAEYTICCWFKIVDLAKTRQMFLLTRTPTETGQGIPGLALAFNDLTAPGAVDYYLGVGGPEGGQWSVSAQHGAKTDYRPNAWYYLTFTKSGADYSLSINGNLEHSLHYPNSFKYSVGLNLGHNDDEPDGAPWFLNGCLDDIRIYSRALSASEVAALYALELGPRLSLVKAVKPAFDNLYVGTNYQLQISGDLSSWTNSGSPFTASNNSQIYPQYWDVANWNDLFFRLQIAP